MSPVITPKNCPFVRKIEVETENLDMVREAVEAGADIIMLDNMTPDEMAEAIRIIDGTRRDGVFRKYDEGKYRNDHEIRRRLCVQRRADALGTNSGSEPQTSAGIIKI